MNEINRIGFFNWSKKVKNHTFEPGYGMGEGGEISCERANTTIRFS